MLKPFEILKRAKDSSFYLRLLNWGVARMVPFNKPHGLKILEIGDAHIRTMLPYKRRNLNHVHGLHACGLATITEFTSGFLLLAVLNPQKYRIIMQRLEMEYHYQGKMDAIANFHLPDDWVAREVLGPLESSDTVVVTCLVKISDTEGNHLTTGKIFWQIKTWDKVKTKL